MLAQSNDTVLTLSTYQRETPQRARTRAPTPALCVMVVNRLGVLTRWLYQMTPCWPYQPINGRPLKGCDQRQVLSTYQWEASQRVAMASNRSYQPINGRPPKGWPWPATDPINLSMGGLSKGGHGQRQVLSTYQWEASQRVAMASNRSYQPINGRPPKGWSWPATDPINLSMGGPPKGGHGQRQVLSTYQWEASQRVVTTSDRSYQPINGRPLKGWS